MLGEALKKARLEKGLTQEEVAARARIHVTFLSAVENNKKSPTVDMLFRLCNAIGIPVSRLMARVERAMAKTGSDRPTLHRVHRGR